MPRLTFRPDWGTELLCTEDGEKNSSEATAIASLEGEFPASISVNAQFLREVLDKDDDRVVTSERKGEFTSRRVEGASWITVVVIHCGRERRHLNRG